MRTPRLRSSFRTRLVQTLADSSLLDGPWDLTIADDAERASVFVSNARNGTVTRLNVRVIGVDGLIVEDATRIASGYTHRCDPAAFVVGPTGVALDRERDVLAPATTEQVASSLRSPCTCTDRSGW